jgi:pimeloyl-ACP methyl ester carboxylesterase
MLADPEARLFQPARPTGGGVLVLAGSSGRVEAPRAELLSRHGAVALAMRWFGGPGQQPGPFEVPVELFSQAVDLLASECDHVALVGTSFGAEAALLAASRDRRIHATVAFAPSSVVWGGVNEGHPTSHWTADGEPLPYVPFVPDWESDRDPPSYLSLYTLSLATYEEAARRAAIPVENIVGEVVLIAGGDDQVWPSVEFAERIASRRREYGRETVVVTVENAGHRTILPGEQALQGNMRMLRGGSVKADSELGRRAWPRIATALRLREAQELG